MIKFTPGPWLPGHFTDPNHSCNCHSIVSQFYAGAIAEVIEHNGIDRIADGSNDAPPHGEAVANAFLIAAAPQLYEALTDLLNVIGDRREYQEPVRYAVEVLARANVYVPPTLPSPDSAARISVEPIDESARQAIEQSERE